MKKLVIGLVCFVTVLLMAQSWYPEGSKPLSGDLEKRSLHKINQLLYTVITNGSIVITNQLSVTNTLSANVQVTNSVGLANTNNLSVFDTNVLNALTAGFSQALTIALNSSNHWNTASNQFNNASNFLASATNSLNNLSNQLGTITNQFNADSNFLAAATNQLNNLSNFLASATNSLTHQSNFLASATNSLNAISNILTGVTAAAGTMVFTNITNADPAVPVVLGVAGWTFKAITFNGFKAARTANVGTVYIQGAAANDSVGIQLLSQGIITVEAAPGTTLNASQFYLDVVTANDGVVIQTFN